MREVFALMQEDEADGHLESEVVQHECVILARAAVLGLVQLLSLPVAR